MTQLIKRIVAATLDEHSSAWETILHAIEEQARPVMDELRDELLCRMAKEWCGFDYSTLDAEMKEEFREEFEHILAIHDEKCLAEYKKKCGAHGEEEIIDEVTGLLKEGEFATALEKLLLYAATIQGFYASQTFVGILSELDAGMFNDLVWEGMNIREADELIDAMYRRIGDTHSAAVADAAANGASGALVEVAMNQLGSSLRAKQQVWLSKENLDFAAQHMRQISEQWQLPSL
jgi:hypothetical protein